MMFVRCSGSKHDFSHFELGRPTVRGDLFAVATDTPEASQHFLAVVDATVMRRSARDDPLICYTPVDEHVSDLHWLTEEVLIGSTGKGNLKLFEFDGKTVKHTGQFSRQLQPRSIALLALTPLTMWPCRFCVLFRQHAQRVQVVHS